MNVIKKELKERTFIPYTITIIVESEQEHKDLKKTLRNYKEELKATGINFNED